MKVRECREEDVDELEHFIPSPGLNRFHAGRFRRQQQGLSTFLVVHLDGVPVGGGEILWAGCGAAEVRERFPGCPELSGLIVWPPERQSQGIGTTMIRAAEDIAARQGRARIGLGVDDQNVRAAALYLRLGYQETGCRYLDRYPYVDDAGVGHEAADPCRFLIKDLPPV